MSVEGVEGEESGGGVRVVLCNCSPQESGVLGRRLVEERLAACVNIVSGVTSIYEWQGELCEEVEHTLVIKTTEARYEALKRRIEELHSYEVPEILAFSCSDALSTYAQWVYEQVSGRV